MGHKDFANVSVRCSKCGHTMTWCVHVDKEVPERLRCSPGPGGGGSESSAITCGNCDAPCFRSVDELKRAVGAALRRGWGPHVTAGAIQVECTA